MLPRHLTLRDDQSKAVENMIHFLSTATKGQSRLYSSPTGSGKSYCQAALVILLGPGHITVVPTMEIARGLWEKLQGREMEPRLSELKQRRLCEERGIYTAGVYKNRLLKSSVPLPKTLCFDEAHNTEAETYESIWQLTGRVPRVGLTATVYRGTPGGTAALLESWNHDVYTILTLAEAVAKGIISKPTFDVWPLVNDDLIDVVNGEFVVSQVAGAVKSKMGDLVLRVGRWFDGQLWDRPTMLALPSVEIVHYAESEFLRAGLSVEVVVGETADRQARFDRVVRREALLLQIKVVSEGVDLPLRRLVDLDPTMSPRKWMQRVGRITRPSADSLPPEYYACNHNLTRHAYLWDGLIPASEIKKAQQAWGADWNPTRRSMARALGLEGFGRFEPTTIPLSDGLLGTFYGLQTKDGSQEYGVFLHPCRPTPSFFHRSNTREVERSVVKTLPDGREILGHKRIFGKWRRIQSLSELKGCVSLAPNRLGPRATRWWQTCSMDRGLDPKAQVNAKQLAFLGILCDTGLKIKPLEG